MDKTVENDVAIIHEDGRILYYSEILEFIELVSIYKEPRKLLLIIADDIMATIMGYVAGIANHIHLKHQLILLQQVKKQNIIKNLKIGLKNL